MLVWDSRTAHANFPNTASNFRIVQFVTMMLADEALECRGGHWARQLIHNDDIEGYGVSAVGRRLLGLDSWHDGPDTTRIEQQNAEAWKRVVKLMLEKAL